MKKILRYGYKLSKLMIVLAGTFVLSWFIDIILRMYFGDLTEIMYNFGIELGLSPYGEFPDEVWWVMCYPWCLFLTVLSLILLVKKIW